MLSDISGIRYAIDLSRVEPKGLDQGSASRAPLGATRADWSVQVHGTSSRVVKRRWISPRSGLFWGGCALCLSADEDDYSSAVATSRELIIECYFMGETLQRLEYPIDHHKRKSFRLFARVARRSAFLLGRTLFSLKQARNGADRGVLPVEPSHEPSSLDNNHAMTSTSSISSTS